MGEIGIGYGLKAWICDHCGKTQSDDLENGRQWNTATKNHSDCDMIVSQRERIKVLEDALGQAEDALLGVQADERYQKLHGAPHFTSAPEEWADKKSHREFAQSKVKQVLDLLIDILPGLREVPADEKEAEHG